MGTDEVATGLGFTNTVTVIGVPSQPFADGVMVKVTVLGNVVVFVKIPLIFPLPLAGIPVTRAVLFLVQSNCVPGTLLVSEIKLILLSEQIVWDVSEATASGIGFTVMVTVSSYVKLQVTA